MRLLDTDSSELDAEFSISDLGDGRFELTIESAGGLTAAGTRRNPDYRRVLEELLRRCGAIDAVLHDAFIASNRTADLSLDERRIQVEGRPFPLTLHQGEDFDRLRKDLTGPQANIGSARREGGGNERKRMTLVISSPTSSSRSALIARLDAIESQASRPGRSGVAAGLTSRDVEAAIKRWRESGPHELQAVAAPRYVVLDGDEEINALALLLGARVVAGLESDGQWRGDRENVANPLRSLGFAVSDLDRPFEGPLGPNPASYVGLAARFGSTDVAVMRMGRREQSFLRGSLGIATGARNAVAQCGMCGRRFPHSLLVAAHIKPRQLCSDHERLDMPWVGWALCVAGCDALFEHGYLGVSDDGQIIGVRSQPPVPTALSELMAPLLGSRAPGWTAERNAYFGAHQARHAPDTESGP